MRVAINGIIINDDKKILIVKKRNHWILPGGKPRIEVSESDIDCLAREIREEIGVEILKYSWYERFEGRTPNTGDMLEARTYFTTIQGVPEPRAEITDIVWAGRAQIQEYQLSDITGKIIESLQQDNHL